MTLNGVKLRLTVTFSKCLASAAYLMFLPKTLIWNKITFPASNLLNFSKLVENELVQCIFKNFANIPFSIRFIAAYCKHLKGL